MCKKFDPFDFDSKHDWDNDGEHGILDEVMDDVIREMYFDEMDDVLNPDFDFDDDEEDDDIAVELPEGEEIGNEEPQEIDPRWNELKKILDNN